MKQWLKEHSLSLVMFGLFLLFIFGQSMAGVRTYNQEQQEHNQPEISYVEYIKTGEFVESVFENWESEFLQMGAYAFLTVFLYQKGSAESKMLEGDEPQDQDPRQSKSKDAPGPVRKGGWLLKVYENSLSLAFLALFIMSFLLHASGGASATCAESQSHNESDCPGVVQYISTSKFWFESFQNWQSEFLAVFAIVVLSIYLRQKGSPESKPVNTPHDKTGSE
jgi:hypothetical protein